MMGRTEMIREALTVAGYESDPTPEALRECFLDYVGAGYFRDLDLDDADEMIRSGEISEIDMIYNLIKKNELKGNDENERSRND